MDDADVVEISHALEDLLHVVCGELLGEVRELGDLVEELSSGDEPSSKSIYSIMM